IAALFQQILATEPRDPREFDPRIPSAARQVFERALSKSPIERYESCSAFVEALAAAAYASEPVAVAAAAPISGKRVKWPLVGGVRLFAGLVICGGLLWLPNRGPKSKVAAAPANTAAIPAATTATSAAPVPDPSLKAGMTRVNRRDDLSFVWIAPGTFR